MLFRSDIAVGEAHTVTLRRDGTVWTMGDNSHGQLGVGVNANGSTLTSSTRLRKVMVDADTALTNISAVSAGANFTLALQSVTDENGDQINKIYVWGTYAGTRLDYATEIQVEMDGETVTDIYRLAARAEALSFLDTKGQIYVNQNVADSDTLIKAQAGEAKDVLTSAVGAVEETDPMVGAIAATASNGHVMFIASEGSVYGYGEDDYSQLGDKDGDGDVVTGDQIGRAHV